MKIALCPHLPEPRRIAWALTFGLVGTLASAAALAQALPPPTGGPYALTRQVIAAGGARASGGAYVLTGTLAQAAVDPIAATGAAYRLSGGFHGALPSRPDALFANGFDN